MSKIIRKEELENRLDEILTEVTLDAQTFLIIENGKLLAQLLPANETQNKAASDLAWNRLKEVSKQISNKWVGVGATEAINEIRPDF